MRLITGCAIGLAATAAIAASSAHAFTVAPTAAAPSTVVLSAGKKLRQGRDCTPYNGPYGFYGNVYCQPPSEMSYMRNLGSPWPQETPPSLKKVKPSGPPDW
jgi:hypothetical protein